MLFRSIGRILLFLLGMYLLSSAFSFIQGWLMTGLSQKACYDFRRQISEKINRLPLAYFEKRTVGEVLSRITNDVDTLGQSLNQSITQLITSVTTMIGVLVMMLSISPRMTLIALLILPVSLALVLVVVKFSQKYFKAQQATLGVVNGQVEEVYAGHNVVKAFNREAVVLADFNAANDKLYESAWKSQFLSGLMMPIMNFVGNLGYVAVAIVGSIFAANGVITIGDIQAFIQYVKNFTQPIQQLSQVSNMLQSMAAAAERVFEFLNEPEEEQLADPARRADPADIDGQVTFDHVRFGYTPDKTVIHDFSCTVQPGHEQELEKTLNSVVNSTFWKASWPLRYLVSKCRQLWRTFPLFVFFATLRQVGFAGVMAQAKAKKEYKKLFPGKAMPADRFADVELLVKQAADQPAAPRISIVVPLYNTPHDFLVELLDSVQNQTYRNWELCMVDRKSVV